MLVDTARRWDGLTDQEWAYIRRYGVDAALRTKTISTRRRRKIRKLAEEHQLFSLGDHLESVIGDMAREYLEWCSLSAA